MKASIRKYILLKCFILLFPLCLFASPRQDQDLILPGHWVYDALTAIELEVRRVTFSDQAPISINELNSYLTDIDYEKLSEPGKIQFERILNYINEDRFSLKVGLFSLGIDPSINPEAYYKSDEETPWVYDYTKRNALFSVPVNFSVGDYFSAYMQFAGMQMYEKRFSSYNYVNEIFSPGAFDGMLTHENYISTGYSFNNGIGINFRWGTGTQSLGNTLMPGIIISEYLTDAPYINLRVYSPVFCYNFNATQLTPSAIFYSHRLDFRLFKRVELSFMEGILPYDSFDLRYIDPFGIFHSYGLFNELQMNSFFGAKFSFTPCQYLRIYGLYAQNEHTMASEENALPEGFGFQVGAETYIPLRKGYLHAGVEGYYTSSYLFIKESPNISFAKVFSELTTSGKQIYQWIGNPLGPDSLAFQLNIGYDIPSVFSVEFVYNLSLKGIFSGTKIFNDVLWDRGLNFTSSNWVYPTETNLYSNGNKYISPHVESGQDIEYQNTMYIQGAFMPTDWLTLVMTPGYSFILNYNNQPGVIRQGFEISLSARIQFSRMFAEIKNPEFLFTDNIK